jgi:PilZ domain-containing protein
VLEAIVTPRAERFAYEGLLSFRPVGNVEWAQGMFVNISPSGVLFRTGQPVDVNKVLQLTYVLPSQTPGKEGDVISCKGLVVRTYPPTANDRLTHLGARILNYQA